MVSLTHGEGFGRPLLEFATTGKPIKTQSISEMVDLIISSDKYCKIHILSPIARNKKGEFKMS